ncbi:MAG: 3-hydroxyacyl-CoA dehydrogenase family protein [Alphaproteobacteria bacterium]|nr:3-hydroxyacyl-CoA dehydrogenase family protein [Alphaproteobacteria bacterium]
MNIRTVGILGAGTMGAGIAQNVIEHGLSAVVMDADPAQLQRAVATIERMLARGVEKGRIDAAGAAAIRARLATTAELARIAANDLVIEAVFEDFAVKRVLYQRLAPLLAAGTLVATNTSALSVDELAEFVPDPARFLGLHYFSPAAVNRLVEVVRGARTAPAAYDRALAFVGATGKQALACRDGLGFAVNRFFCPYTNEATRLHDEGHDPAAIDQVARASFAAPLGPFAVMNLTKPRIALHAQRSLARLGAFYAPSRSLERVGEAGGSWTLADPPPAPDPAARALIADRLRAATFLPVLQLVGEGIAEAADVDLGARVALRWDDPPVAQMDRLGRDAVAGMLRPLLKRYEIESPAALIRVGTLGLRSGAAANS